MAELFPMFSGKLHIVLIYIPNVYEDSRFPTSSSTCIIYCLLDHSPSCCSRLTVSPAVLWITAHPAAAGSQCGFDVYLGWWPRLRPFSSNSWLFVVMPSLEKIWFRFTAYFSLFNFCLLCYWVAFDLLSKSLHFREQIKSLKHRGLPQTNN